MIRQILSKEWVIGLLLSLTMLLFASSSLVAHIDGLLFDIGQSLMRSPSDPTDDTVIIHIDPASLSQLGGSQQQREGLVQLVDKMRPIRVDLAVLVPLNEQQKNPALDGLESLKEYVNSAGLPNKNAWKLKKMLSDVQDGLDVDGRLVQTLRNMSHVILPVMPDETGDDKSGWLSGFVASGISPLGQRSKVLPEIYTHPDPMFSDRAAALGSLQLLTDAGGTVHGFSLLEMQGEKPVYSIPLLLAANKPSAISSSAGELAYNRTTLRTDRRWQGYLRNYDQPFKTYTLAEVLADDFRIARLKDKTVVVASDGLMRQRYRVSGGAVLNVAEIIGLGAANLKNRDLLTTTDSFAAAEWAMYLISALLLIALMPLLRYVFCVALAGLSVLTLASTTGYLMLTSQLWVKSGAAILLMLLGAAVIGMLRLYTSQSTRHRADVAHTLRQLGLAYQEQGKKEQAFEAFKKLPPKDENLELIYNLALDFERQRRYERAAAVYLHILMANPKFKDAAKRRLKAEKMGEAALTSSGQFSHAVLLLPDEDGHNPKLGRYEVEKEIGKGAMGAVYLGRDPKIDRTVAIKTLALSQEFGPDEIKEVEGRFFHEASAAGKLNHPNIVTIYDAGEEHDLAYIAMEFLEGKPLSDYVRSSKLLPVTTVLNIMAQVADGLDYAAKAGVVHRDIKPANIMFNDKTGMVKITDFGIARLTSSSRTKTGTILGTPSFMSPEQITTQQVDGRTDIFSLGATMYVLLTGKRPFSADSLAALTFQITSEKHPDILKIRPQLPACIKPVIDKALQKAPSSRYTDGQAMRRAILRCLKQME